MPTFPPTFQDPNNHLMPFPVPMFPTDTSGNVKSYPHWLSDSSGNEYNGSQPFPVTAQGTVNLSSTTLSALAPIAPISPFQGVLSVSIPAGTLAATNIKSSSGVFFGICINSVGVGSPQAFDNAVTATGKVLATIAGSAALGLANAIPSLGAQFANGLTISGSLTNPAMTVYYL